MKIKSIINRLKSILTESSEPIELLLGCLSLAYGIWLFNPFLATFASVSTYTYLSQLVSEPILGFVMMTLGASRIVALFRNNNQLRRIMGLVGNFLWMFLFINVSISNLASTAVPVFFILSCTSLYVYLRIPVPSVVKQLTLKLYD